MQFPVEELTVKNKKKWLAATLVVAVLTIPWIAKRARGEDGISVDISTVGKQSIRPTILSSGILAFGNEVSLTAELVARVDMIAVKEGDTVVAGQLLMQLDPETYRNAIRRENAGRTQSAISIERQKVALGLRTLQFERSKKMLAAQMIERSRFDEDRNQLDLARVDLKGSQEALRRADAVLGEAREQLEKTQIRSPMAGKVVALPIKVGETAIPSTSALAGAQLITIADTSVIHAELKVDEADIANIKPGQQADIFASAFPDSAIKGVVTKIALAATIEGLGRAYKVTLDLKPDQKMALRSGMSARADIFLGDGTSRLAVPVEAVGTESAKDGKPSRFVWLNRDGIAKKVVIQTGDSDDAWEEVSSGLAEGDQVIVGPAKTWRMLAEGDSVRQQTKQERESYEEQKEDGDAKK